LGRGSERWTLLAVLALAVAPATACNRGRSSRGEASEVSVSAPVEAGPFELGRPATSADLSAFYPTVFPDGVGLPDGQGTAADGETIYRERCAACHGARGEGATASPLVGGVKPAMGYRIGRAPPGQPRPSMIDFFPYATTLSDYTRRAMPQMTAGSLTDAETYSVVGWMLFLNGLVPKDQVLDRHTLPKVKMPALARLDYEEK
jgi:mono/diheme cytochrome c family protein